MEEKNRRIMPLLKFAVCDCKKSKFFREQEESIKQVNTSYKMNQIVNKFLLADLLR